MKERFRLDDVTKQLQVISLNADSHLANAGTAITNASSVRHAHARLHCVLRPNSTLPKQASADAIDYLMASLEKQKMWFLNYKSRKDNTMGLVYNLVTQQDAANNIGIATEMRKDSSSMHAIAALTMVFLPGTFTAVSPVPPRPRRVMASVRRRLVADRQPPDGPRRRPLHRHRPRAPQRRRLGHLVAVAHHHPPADHRRHARVVLLPEAPGAKGHGQVHRRRRRRRRRGW